MANWTTIPTSVLEVGKPVRSIDIIALRDNDTAMMEKAAGAPVLANNYVVEAMIAAGQVSQGKLKTALNTINVSADTGGTQAILSGGQYCFEPTIQLAGGTQNDSMFMASGGSLSASGSGLKVNMPYEDTTPTQIRTNYTINLTRGVEYTFVTYMASGGTNDTFTINARYVNASPPYNLGNGDMSLFVFVVLRGGVIVQCWIADDPPWAHNGPTKITPDFHDPATGKAYRLERQVTAQQLTDLLSDDPVKHLEARLAISSALVTAVEITQELKNRDMPLVPHPFASQLPGDVVVMMPICSLLDEFRDMHHLGENIGGIFTRGYVAFDNTPLDVVTPPGVLVCSAAWKLTH